MCGILAYVGDSLDEHQFETALNLLSHRGPDDSGIKTLGNVTLGHRRLSIIDLDSSSSQPMTCSESEVSIVFNGEIYNFRELRKNLVKQGTIFRTNGDTEVLLKLYLEEGIKCLDKLNGMFAIVIVDKRIETTYLVRDRLGIKPLYYYHSTEELITASEVKAIAHLVSQDLPFNEKAFSSYMSFRASVFDETFFKGIYSVKPGTYLKVKNGEMTQKTYWSLADYFIEKQDDKGEAYYLRQLRKILSSSVNYRMIADVPVGAYLSGGVDSSAIVGLMSEQSTRSIPTYTIGFADKGYNEFDFARITAEKNSCSHHELEMDSETYLKVLKKLLVYKDAPLSVPNEVPLFLMNEELKKRVKVVLSGEGADELFAGYGRIFRSADEFRNTQLLRGKNNLSVKETEFLKRIKQKYGKDFFEDEVDHFFENYSYTSDTLKSQVLNERVHNKQMTVSLKERFREIFNEVPKASYENKMMYFFQKIHLPILLARVDMTTMASSVEARVPFVDHRLVEFAASLPLKYKLKWDSSTIKENDLYLAEDISEIHDIPKYLLKKSMEDLVDERILYRKKVGFPVPLNEWFRKNYFHILEDKLKLRDLSSQRIVDFDGVGELMRELKSGSDAKIGMELWMILNIILFIENYTE